jgi:UDP-GlcNAc:undecaprenyl-phosphate/decaprenyl-phosphate GlcNAc-1-phosphate transferase
VNWASSSGILLPAQALLLATILSLGLTPVVRRLSLRHGIVDLPGHRKIHSRPTALLGGLAVFAAVAGTAFLLRAVNGPVFILLLGGAAMLGIGLADDAFDIGASKFVAELVLAALVVAASGLSFRFPWPSLSPVLTVLWIVGVTNAFNCLDCADGASSATGAVGALALLAVAAATHRQADALLAAAIAGALLGFLPYNLAPARIFLGDAGSLTLGYLLAMVAVMHAPATFAVPAVVSPAVILAVPIYDIVRVHLVRFIKGERSIPRLLTSSGKDHLPHRLLERGVPQRKVPLVLMLVSGAVAVVGIGVSTLRSPGAALVVVVAVAAAFAIAERATAPTGSKRQAEGLGTRLGWRTTDGT